MPNKIQIKRTTTSGLLPNVSNSSNTSYIAAGELAINLTDRKLLSSNGSATFEIGANLASMVVGTGFTLTSGNANFDSGVLFVDGTNNRVGVGNTTPGHALSVTGTTNLGGVVTATANVILGTTTISANGSVGTAGQILTSGGSGNVYWSTGGGGGSPGGANTQIQFNDSGSFGGDAGLTYNKTTDALTVAGALTVNGAVTVPNTAALGNTTITGFANVTSTIQGGAGLTIAGAASGITTLAAGNTTITGFANVSSTLNAAGAITQNGNQVLHAGNYTSYAPSLTGSGASGSWGISITGNAAGATFSNDSVTQDDITTRTDSGFYQSSTGTTAEGWPLNDGTWQHMISCTHSNDGNYYAMQLGSGFYSQGLFYRATNGSGSTAWSRVALYNNSYDAALYASAYYDSNNTAYYLDAANAGASDALKLNGGIGFAIANPYLQSSSYFVIPGGAYFNSGTVYTEANIKARGGVGNDTAAALTLTGGTGGYTQINGSARSPIFYDSDNTGYLVDASGTSFLNVVGTNGNLDVYGNQYLRSSFLLLNTAGNDWNFVIDRNGGNNWIVYGGNSVRAPIFYDSNNTAYYLDAANTGTSLILGGLLQGGSSAATDVNTANDTGSFSARGNTSTVACMSFHRTGAYAINMGLGTDNVFRIGGWSASNNAFQMDGSGNLTMLNNVTAYSDARLKKDIVKIDNAIDKVQQLNGYTYTRTDTGSRQCGVIAQEVMKVLPEVVMGSEETNYSVAYGNMVGLLIEAIKEQQEQINRLEVKINSLQQGN